MLTKVKLAKKSKHLLVQVLALILQVLADFPHTTAELRVDYLLDLFPEIQARSFSIASSLQVSQSFVATIKICCVFEWILMVQLQMNIWSTQTHPNRLQILVAVVQYKTKLYKPRRGLCSSWLASLDPKQGPSTNLPNVLNLNNYHYLFTRAGNGHAHLKSLCKNICAQYLNVIVSCVSGEVYVPLWVKSGTLKFPEDKDIPVIMVGPGTGVAPFRSALQERIAEGKYSMTFFVLWLYTKIYVLCTPVYCGGGGSPFR